VKLTSYTNYALRSLQLAALNAPSLVRIDDVVKIHGLAKPHVRKIIHVLGRADLLVTHRGRSGGFQLARAANTIVVGDVVRLTEGPLDVVECFNPKTNTCPLIGVSSNKAQLLNRIAPLHPLDQLDHGTPPDYNKKSA